MAPPVRNKPSENGDLFDCRTNIPRLAGYVGLKDTDQLKAYWQTDAFLSPYNKWITEGKNYKTARAFALLSTYAKDAEVGPGTESPNTTTWTVHHHTAHCILRIIKLAPPELIFGPLPEYQEKDLEAWNRALSLMSSYKYTKNTSQKEKIWGDAATSSRAVKPQWMTRETQRLDEAHVPAEPLYPTYRFKAFWKNKEAEEVRLSPRPLKASPVAILDPRVFDGRQMRDHLRRVLELPELKANIASMMLKYDDVEYDTFEDWPDIQILLQDETTLLKNARFEFMTRPKNSDDEDIFEVYIPPGQSHAFSVDENGQVIATAPEAMADELVEDVNEDAEPSGGVPTNFYPPEDLPSSFDIKSDAANDSKKRRDYQKITIQRLIKGLRVKAQAFKTISTEDQVAHTQLAHQARAADLAKETESPSKFGEEDKKRFAELIQIRGGETHVGPAYDTALRLLGLKADHPKIGESKLELRAAQVTGICWVVLQMLGQIPGATNAEKRTIVKGGIIGDDMGMGKTDLILGAITWVNRLRSQPLPVPDPYPGLSSSLYAPGYKPTFIVCPSNVVYKWASHVEKNWPELRPLLLFGKNSGEGSTKHEKIRILRDDFIVGPGGNLDKVRPDLRYLFDTKDPAASKAVVLTSYATFRDRFGMKDARYEEENKGENKGVKWLSIMPDVIGHLVLDEGQACKNRTTKVWQVLKESNATYRWILTGIPMANRDEDIIDLAHFLYRNEWLEQLPVNDQDALFDGSLRPFVDDDESQHPKLRLQMLNRIYLHKVFSAVDKSDQAQKLEKLLKLIYIRRTRETTLQNGDKSIQAGASLQPMQIRTVQVAHSPAVVAEYQFHQQYLAAEFLKLLRPEQKSKQINAPHKKQKYEFPTALFRLMSLHADGLAFTRLISYLQSMDLKSLSSNVQQWRAANPPIGIRWWAQKCRTPLDPVLNTKEAHLQLVADITPRLKYLASYVLDIVVSTNEPIIVAVEWNLCGLLIEKFFEAMHFRVAVIHTGLQEIERHELVQQWNKKDGKIEILILSYRVSALGLDCQHGGHHMVLWEAAINIPTEWEMWCRIWRDGQKEHCYVTRIYGENTFDKYRENRATEKMFGEMATWSQGTVMQERMKKMLLTAGVEKDKLDLEDTQQLNMAARMILQDMMGQQESREGAEAHVVYDQLKRGLQFAIAIRARQFQ